VEALMHGKGNGSFSFPPPTTFVPSHHAVWFFLWSERAECERGGEIKNPVATDSCVLTLVGFF
jgi:hypothetical protein